MRPLKKALGAFAVLVLTALPAFATELVMIEDEGCIYCARWNAEIAPAYPKTAEGRFAPLRRIDIDTLPNDLALSRKVRFTPTFLVVENGTELARLEGYPGQDFFWPLLDRLLTEHTGYLGGNQ